VNISLFFLLFLEFI